VTDIVLRGSFDTSQQRRYVHVPFAVPPGVGALHISYDYSDRISSDPRRTAATRSTSACSTHAVSRHPARVSVAGAAATSSPSL